TSADHTRIPVSIGHTDFYLITHFGVLRALHSFPTRRSSDLASAPKVSSRTPGHGATRRSVPPIRTASGRNRGNGTARRAVPWGRSEELTSELQSRFDLVCRLLLEKIK